jgi:flagellar hook-length control protein FliK
MTATTFAGLPARVAAPSRPAAPPAANGGDATAPRFRLPEHKDTNGAADGPSSSNTIASAARKDASADDASSAGWMINVLGGNHGIALNGGFTEGTDNEPGSTALDSSGGVGNAAASPAHSGSEALKSTAGTSERTADALDELLFAGGGDDDPPDAGLAAPAAVAAAEEEGVKAPAAPEVHPHRAAGAAAASVSIPGAENPALTLVPAAPSTGQPAAAGAASASRTPVASGELPSGLADHVEWQIGQGLDEARLDLHPQELGSIQVHIRMAADGAEVSFAAAQPQTRDLLAASLPQLRALLGADGVNLMQAQISSTTQSAADSRAGELAVPAAPRRAGRIARIQMIDDFA